MKDLDVLCAGLSVLNFPVHPVDENIFRNDVTQVAPIDMLMGGDAANQAIVLTRLGNRAALATRRGDDEFGRAMIALLAKCAPGLNLESVAVDPAKATSACVILIRPDGQRNFCVHKGALRDFCLGDVDAALIARAKVVSIGGLFALPSFDREGAIGLFRRAKEEGAITVADTKHDMMGIGLDGIRSCLAHTDFFFPSYDEASAISGEKSPEAIAGVFLRAGAKNVGIKLGADGCYLRGEVGECRVPAAPAAVVDTTGAGDNFMAGFITGLVRGWKPVDCCRLGAAVSAVCISKVGANTAVESFAQVEQVLGRM